ncbi:MAG: hypothetical protein IPK80_23595 [Nannocystis sp.]|nr:hypothetical protein [Nannocystis sp.]
MTPEPGRKRRARRPGLAALRLLLLALLAACPAAPAPPRAPRPADKRALYGDPALLPTRRGELAREELALAGEIERLLADDPTLAPIRAHVALPPEGAPVVVIAAAADPADRPRLAAIARAVVPHPQLRVVLHPLPAAAPPAPPPPLPVHLWPLALALLALGASAGITLDRLRLRRPPR